MPDAKKEGEKNCRPVRKFYLRFCIHRKIERKNIPSSKLPCLKIRIQISDSRAHTFTTVLVLSLE